MFIRSGGRVTSSAIDMGFIYNLRNFFGSIRFYVIFLIVIAGLVPPVFITAILLNNYENRAISARTTTIITQSQVLAGKIADERFFESGNDPFVVDEIELLGNFFSGRIMIVDSSCKVVYDTYDQDVGKTVISSGVIECLSGTQNSNYDSDNEYIEVSVPISDSGSDNIRGAILVAASTAEISGNSAYMINTSMSYVVFFIIFIFIIAIFGSYRLLRPFGVMSDSIDKMQMDYDNEELKIMDYSETRQISEAFNEMLGRMKSVDDSRQEFVSNVSHELKTPLASMKVLADSLLSQEDAPAELYREFLEDIAAEIDRENDIITDLLSLTKLDKTTGVLNIEDVNINEMTELIIKRVSPLAQQRNINISFEAMRPVIAQVDEVKMALVITNLIENGIKYNKENGYVRVTLNADGQFFYLKVEDSGLGIPDEDIDKIFERFYRGDKSHSKETSGTGLGLSIVRNAVLMHRGAIAVDSEEGTGSTFSVRIPLANSI